MTTTEEELAAKQERNVELRDQIAAAAAKRAEFDLGVSNEVTAAALDAEGDALQEQLDALNKTNEAAESGATLEQLNATMTASVRAQQLQDAENARLQAALDAHVKENPDAVRIDAVAVAEAAFSTPISDFVEGDPSVTSPTPPDVATDVTGEAPASVPVPPMPVVKADSTNNKNKEQ